uniref:Uncharacterized protein n=1 Tax=Solanum lycopersicum TaxID=4081 RepID=A0A3Q7HK32_SOLLC
MGEDFDFQIFNGLEGLLGISQGIENPNLPHIYILFLFIVKRGFFRSSRIQILDKNREINKAKDSVGENHWKF